MVETMVTLRDNQNGVTILQHPPEGEDTRGEAAITVGTVQGARTQASRTLSGSAVSRRRRPGDEFPPCCCHVVRNT